MIPYSSVADNPFAVLSFLAAPAILTNASTLLALGTSNRLARASDRARLAATAILAAPDPKDDASVLQHKDFQCATRRAQLLVTALRMFYAAAGAFAAGACVALLGAFATYFGLPGMVITTQVLTVIITVAGVAFLVRGAMVLLTETRIALRVLDDHHAAITKWRATRQLETGLPE